MQYIEEIGAFTPATAQEASDRYAILWYIQQFGDSVLSRENLLAHLTSSGFIMNEDLSKVLMIHHNIRNTWAWTGGHVDGEKELLPVALREATEETGVQAMRALSPRIASMDILPVYGHVRRGAFVSAHLHLNVCYILQCSEKATLHSKPDENSGVRWFGIEDIQPPLFSQKDVRLYTKLAHWAQSIQNDTNRS